MARSSTFISLCVNGCLGDSSSSSSLDRYKITVVVYLLHHHASLWVEQCAAGVHARLSGPFQCSSGGEGFVKVLPGEAPENSGQERIACRHEGSQQARRAPWVADAADPQANVGQLALRELLPSTGRPCCSTAPPIGWLPLFLTLEAGFKFKRHVKNQERALVGVFQLGIILCMKRSPVHYLVMVYTQVAGLVLVGVCLEGTN